jgi:hypothetical protein
MTVEHNLACALREGCPDPNPASGVEVTVASADIGMCESRQLQPDRSISAFHRDEPEYLDALRIEFKRRVRDHNLR